MIPVISKKQSSGSIIEYNENKVQKGEAVRIYENFFTLDIEEKKAHYDEIALMNSRIRKNKYSHIVLSFPKEDQVLDDKGLKISHEYLENMGYSNVPLLIYRHDDTQYQHYHIVTSTIDYEGKKVSDKNDFYRSMETARFLEKKYSLSPTIYSRELNTQSLKEINSSKYSIFRGVKVSEMSSAELGLTQKTYSQILTKKLSNQEIKTLLANSQFERLIKALTNKDVLKPSKKTILISKLDKLLETSSSPKEYQNRLKENKIYFRTLQDGSGNMFIKYGDSETGFYISDRKLPERFRYSSIGKTGDKRSVSELQQRKYIRQTAIRTLNKAENLHHYSVLLSRYNIGIDLASNSRGIYGISFYSLNEENPMLFKGSKLDRTHLSWNNISSKIPINPDIDKLLPPPFKQVIENREIHAERTKVPVSSKNYQSLDTSYEQQQTEAAIRKRKQQDKEQER